MSSLQNFLPISSPAGDGRHFRVDSLELLYAFKGYAEKYSNKSLQQVGVSHKQHFEQYIGLKRVFQFLAFVFSDGDFGVN
jgi:hypothetical protein